MITKPMLAVAVEDLSLLKFPVYASPKLDGIRCLMIEGNPLTRKFKSVPNQHILRTLRHFLPEGIDGEIMVPGKSFNEVQSDVMSFDGTPDFEFHAFDLVTSNLSEPFSERYKKLEDLVPNASKFPNAGLRLVPHILINNIEELNAFENKCLSEGYEGVMIRDPKGPYKCGRSTLKEGYLLKLKRFHDAEAKIIDMSPKMENQNEAEKDELGHTKRSSKKEGLVALDTLGSLHVEDVKTGNLFSIGTGLNDALRLEIWNKSDSYIGKLVKYKYQELSKDGIPRFPVFLGFRDERDL